MEAPAGSGRQGREETPTHPPEPKRRRASAPGREAAKRTLDALGDANGTSAKSPKARRGGIRERSEHDRQGCQGRDAAKPSRESGRWRSRRPNRLTGRHTFTGTGAMLPRQAAKAGIEDSDSAFQGLECGFEWEGARTTKSNLMLTD